MTRKDFCDFIAWLEEYDGSADLEPYHDLLKYLERKFAASPLPAEPPPTELTLGEILESATKEVATWEPWQRSLDPFGPAAPSAAEGRSRSPVGRIMTPTNPVNAGADIEKELAEKLGWRIVERHGDAEVQHKTVDGWSAGWYPSLSEVALWAALLAEAGERKRIEADLAQCYRLSGADPDGNEDWRLAPRAVEEVKRLRADSDAAELRASTEAERARGLERKLEFVLDGARLSQNIAACEVCKGMEAALIDEFPLYRTQVENVAALQAQLETARQALALAVDHLDWIGWGDSYERSAAREDGTMSKIRAALSQLPTPVQERADSGPTAGCICPNPALHLSLAKADGKDSIDPAKCERGQK